MLHLLVGIAIGLIRQDPPSEGLTLAEPIPCRSIAGYNDYVVREPAEITKDEKLFIYLGVSGHEIVEKEGRYSAHLAQDIRIRRKGKKKILWERKKIIDLKPVSDYPPTRLFLGTSIGLKHFTPGVYEAELVVTDRIAVDTQATRTLEFRVIPPRPRDRLDDPPGHNNSKAPPS